MLTLNEIARRVGNRIQKSDSAFTSQIKDWIDYRYDIIWRRFLWPASVRSKESGVVLVATEAFLLLPKDVDELLMIAERGDNKVLFNTNLPTLWRSFVNVIDNPGQPINYSPAGVVGFKDNLDAAGTIDVKSSAAADTTQVVRIWGLVSGEEITETLTLNGTTPVTSVNTYDSDGFIRASKSANTVGAVTVEATAGGKDLVVMSQEEFTAYHKRIRLRHVPDSGDVVSIVYKKRRVRLVNNEDIPEFDCAAALESGAYADAWKEQKQYSKAQIEESRFESLISDLIREQKMQGENLEMALPHIESGQRGLRLT